MNDGLIISILSVVPKNRVAGWMGAIARVRWPRWMLRAFLRWYVPHYGVNLDECVGGIDDYASIVDFFTRPLRPGVRPVAGEPEALVSPVDGKVYTIGKVEGGKIPQGHGHVFDASALAGGSWEGAPFAVIYLSPKDYHRVHSPREGRVTRMLYRPGALWPVFPAATRLVPGLFAINERLSLWLDTDVGRAALVMVGAFGVGRMRVVFDPIATNEGAAGVEREVSVPLGRAEELGRFEMGSTVVLLFPPGTVTWEVAPGDVVRLGQRIGKCSIAPPGAAV